MHLAKLSAEPPRCNLLLERLLLRKLWMQALLIQLSSYIFVANIETRVLVSPIVLELKSLGINLHQTWIWLAIEVMLVSGLTGFAKMPIWWRWINVIFPVAVVGMQLFAFPPLFYFLGFLITAALYWSVQNTRVPFYPSFPATWRAMHTVLDQFAGERMLNVLDIGSGIGDIAMFLSKQRPQDHVSGIEIAPLPWLISALRAKFSTSRAHFALGNYHQLDFSTMDVIFAYLSTAAMEEVWSKVHREMQPGSLFISYEFPVPAVQATRTIYPTSGSPALYVYQL